VVFITMQMIMKKILRRFIIPILIMALLLSGSFSAFAATSTSLATATNPTTIKVQYNGENIIFNDAVPKIVNGRTMVPFRQILEEMGAVVSYDLVSKTVNVSKDQLKMSFKIGGNEITLIDGKQTSIIHMDVAPFVDPKTFRTYVSARFMAESLGYSVGWDDSAKAVIINDYETLFANANDDFSILNMLIVSEIDLNKTYHLTGDFNTDIKTYFTGTGIPLQISGNIDSLQKKANAQIELNFVTDLEEYINSLPKEQTPITEAQIAMLKNINIKMKLNGDAGILYLNAPILATYDSSIDGKTWIKMDLTEKLGSDMGIDYQGLMKTSNSDMNIERLLSSYVTSNSSTDVEAYNNAKTMYAFLKNLVGDDAFIKINLGNSSSYSLKLNPLTVTKALAKTALTEGFALLDSDLAQIKDSMNSVDFNFDILINANNDKLSSYDLAGDVNYQEIKSNFKLSRTQMSSSMEIGVIAKDMLDINITWNSLLEESTQDVNLNLPAGSKIIDYTNII
jgi:hypothetical protein